MHVLQVFYTYVPVRTDRYRYIIQVPGTSTHVQKVQGAFIFKEYKNRFSEPVGFVYHRITICSLITGTLPEFRLCWKTACNYCRINTFIFDFLNSSSTFCEYYYILTNIIKSHTFKLDLTYLIKNTINNILITVQNLKNKYSVNFIISKKNDFLPVNKKGLL